MTTEQFTIPCDIRLEQDVLSAVVFNSELVDVLCYELTIADFHFPSHIKIFSAIKYFNDENVTIKTDVLFKHFEKSDSAVINSLLDLSNQHFSTEMLDLAIRKLKAISTKRSMFRASEAGLKLFNGPSEVASDQMRSWLDSVRNISNGAQNFKYYTLKELFEKPYEHVDGTLLQHIQRRQEIHRSGEEVFTGYKTRYDDIDRIFEGFNDGHLTLIGARPGVGKTTFMVNLALRQLLINKIGVGIFSLEMTADQMAEKVLYTHADVSWDSARKGKITSEEYRELVVRSKELEGTSLLLDDKGRSDLNLILARAHHWKERYGVKMIFIDYVQLIKASGKFNNKYEEITHISQQLKIMAKELNLPIISLAQLNRSSEKTSEKIPQVADLRDSGSLEQDADQIFLLHSPSLYDKTDKPGIIQVFLRKNRFGATGAIDLQITAATGKINNLMRIEHVKLFGQDR